MPDISIEPSLIRRRRIQRLSMGGLAITILIALTIWAMDQTSGRPSVRRSDIWIATVKHGRLPITVSASGVFRPIDQRWITAATPGVVEAVKVHPGDAVTPNTVLAVLSNPAVNSALAQSRANLASAEAESASLHARLSSQLLSLQANLASTQAQATTLAVKERAERPLVHSHIISMLQYTAIRVQAAEYAQLARLAEKQISVFRQSMAAQDRAAAAQVAALHAVFDSTRQSLAALVVAAGLSGVVQDVAVHDGQTLAVGGSIARVARLKSLKVTLQVPASAAGEVTVGQPVTLTLATEASQDLRGRVSRISPSVKNGNVAIDVRPTVTVPEDVRPNLAVTGAIHIADIQDAAYIERPAFATPDSTLRIFRLIDHGKAAVPVSVRFGAASDRYIQILSGLNPGDRVIISGSSAFANSRRITLR